MDVPPYLFKLKIWVKIYARQVPGPAMALKKKGNDI